MRVAPTDRQPTRSDELVSVIVPTRNSASHLRDCLLSIRHQSHPEIELIVVDNHSQDATAEIARDLADAVLTAGPERSAQRNVGAHAARGHYVFFIDSDMILESEVVAEAIAYVRSGEAEAVIIPEISFGKGFWARCKTFERSFYTGDDTIEAARFFKSDAFFEVGGFDETMPPGPEDWDLHEHFRLRNEHIPRTEAFIHHDEGELRLGELMQKKFYYGKGMPDYLRKHPARARSQLRVVRPAFVSQWRELTANPTTAAGTLLMRVCEFGAGAAGFLAGTIAARNGKRTE
jgi:glycosyltransferase involved in cell wall biosynthesis